MGLLDTMKQADEQQTTTEMLAEWTSRLPAVELQLSKLTKTVADLTAFVKVMDEQQEARLKRLSTSQQHEQLSRPQLDDETKSRIAEIEKTLAGIAKTVSDERVVKLSSGESVRASQLDSLALTTRIEKQVGMMAQSSAELAEAVRKRGTIRIDADKVNAHFAGQLDSRLERALDPSVARIEQSLSGFEQRVSVVGAERASQAAREIEGVTAKADALVDASKAAERRLETLEGKITWTAVGRMCLALLPLAAVLFVIGGLTMGGCPRARVRPYARVGVVIVRSCACLVAQGTDRSGAPDCLHGVRRGGLVGGQAARRRLRPLVRSVRRGEEVMSMTEDLQKCGICRRPLDKTTGSCPQCDQPQKELTYQPQKKLMYLMRKFEEDDPEPMGNEPEL